MEIEISKPEGPALWAVTGNIGAGKSVVARMLAEKRNAALVDADEEAHRVYAQNAALRRALAEEFGRVVLIGGEDSPDGTDVDREVLGRLVFGEENRSALARLDAIVRPVLLGRFLELFQNRGSRGRGTGRLIRIPDLGCRLRCRRIGYRKCVILERSVVRGRGKISARYRKRRSANLRKRRHLQNLGACLLREDMGIGVVRSRGYVTAVNGCGNAVNRHSDIV